MIEEIINSIVVVVLIVGYLYQRLVCDVAVKYAEDLKQELELTKQILRIQSSEAGAKPGVTIVKDIKFNDEDARRN